MISRIRISNKTVPNFIGAWTLEHPSICDTLIDYFENNTRQQRRGITSQGYNTNSKKSIDINIQPKDLLLPQNEILRNYIDILFECHKDYLNQWPFISTFAERIEIGRFNMQRYLPGDHFQKVHTERFSVDTLHRLFAFMTYLNNVDIDDGGSTYFKHYDLDIQPKKGLTLIWPAEWTHAHRGNILKSGSKYIVTGWMDLSL